MFFQTDVCQTRGFSETSKGSQYPYGTGLGWGFELRIVLPVVKSQAPTFHQGW